MTETSSPLHPLLNEINKAAVGGFPFLAVVMTIALPDICVSLVSQDGRSNGERYKDWCKDNLGPGFEFVTGDDLWSMRCGVLHNGWFGDLKHNVGRVIFALPGRNTLVDCQLGDAYFYSVVTFCANFTKAVADWFEKNKNDPNLQANLPRLMQWRPNGFPPYIAGAAVLA